MEKNKEINISGLIKESQRTIMALGTNPTHESAGYSFFDGKIYSVVVYNRGLTEDEVAQNAQIALDKANNN